MAIPHHAEALPGTWNFRDIGGIATANGPIRSGVVYRSAVLSQLAPASRSVLEKFGVTDVFDLRGPLEIVRDGADQVPDSVSVTVAPFHPEEGEIPGREAQEGATPPTPSDRALAYYAAMPIMVPAQNSVATLLRTVADGSGSVLVHCAAGKDRTGWTIATLLTAVGAHRDEVLADYLLSNNAIESLRIWMQAQYGDSYLSDDGILGVQPSYLQAAWDSVERNFGSFDGYLGAIGIDDDVVRRLRGRLID